MNRLLQMSEVAERLHVSVQRGYELARKGMIPSVRLGKQIRVDAEELEAFIRRGGASAEDNGESGV
jgi:putative molybdopterin biosynthesis protein